MNILSLYVNYENKSSLTYEIDGVGAQILNIIPKNGTLTLKNKVDREVGGDYTLGFHFNVKQRRFVR